MAEKNRISKAADMQTRVGRYLLQRWAEHLKPIKEKVIEAGLVGKSFTETSHDMPGGRINYSFAADGSLVFDFKSRGATGQSIIHYVDFETGWRALADENYDYMKAFEEGKFWVEPSPQDALRMAPLMPDMAKAFAKAIRDTEKEFNIELPKY